MTDWWMDSQPIALWRYESLMVDERTLNAIADMLDGVEWDGSTIEQVADMVRSTGRKIDPPE